MAIPAPTILLHVGGDVTVLEYLVRVLAYLVAFGGIAGLTYWLAGLVDPSQSRFLAAPGGEEGEQ